MDSSVSWTQGMGVVPSATTRNPSFFQKRADALVQCAVAVITESWPIFMGSFASREGVDTAAFASAVGLVTDDFLLFLGPPSCAADTDGAVERRSNKGN